MTRIGSLCSGYGGLDMGLAAALGVDVGESVAWHAEYEAAPSAVLDHHWPHIPNLHDITAIDWTEVDPVDWLTAGYPCQPFSSAGKRKGTNDERHLWPSIAEAIRHLRPGDILLENVAGHRSMGFGAVLGELASIGYVGSWVSVRADQIGACHRRERVFIHASDATGGGRAGEHDGAGRKAARGGRERVAGGGAGSPPAADPEGVRRVVGDTEDIWPAAGDGDAPRHTDRATADADGLELRVEPVAEPGGGCPPVAEHVVQWGRYEGAIRRWERTLGRPSPAPSQATAKGNQRLAPRFVEWMMGLPAGHVTDVPGLGRDEQLHVLGNGVVPQQAAEAVRWLLTRELVAA